MSKKVYDKCGNRRLITIAFRASVEESRRINDLVKASGMTKQDYIINRLECQDVIVNGNPKVFIRLKRLLQELNDKLSSFVDTDRMPDQYTLDTINYVARILEGMKGDMKSDKEKDA